MTDYKINPKADPRDIASHGVLAHVDKEARAAIYASGQLKAHVARIERELKRMKR
jgi:hypothetical protein